MSVPGTTRLLMNPLRNQKSSSEAIHKAPATRGHLLEFAPFTLLTEKLSYTSSRAAFAQSFSVAKNSEFSCPTGEKKSKKICKSQKSRPGSERFRKVQEAGPSQSVVFEVTGSDPRQ